MYGTRVRVTHNNQRSNSSNNTTLDRLLPKPTDVAKAILDSSQYAGNSDEPFRSKYQVFLRACTITGLKESEQVLRLTVMEVGFLIGVALDYFQRSGITSVRTTDYAAGMIENHFLPHRVRAMNETAFNALSLDHVASIVPHPRTNASVLEAFFSRLERLGRVKLYDATDIQLSARLRDIAMDNSIYFPVSHSHGTYAEMQNALRERANRADLPQTRARIRYEGMALSQEENEVDIQDDLSLLTDRVYRVPG
jgi:hypothetical protein